MAFYLHVINLDLNLSMILTGKFRSIRVNSSTPLYSQSELSKVNTVEPRYNEVSRYRKSSLQRGFRYSEDPVRHVRANDLVNNKNIRYSGVNCALGPSKSIRYSGVCFHIFYCNSAGLSNVARCNGVFIIAGFHCNTNCYSNGMFFFC